MSYDPSNPFAVNSNIDQIRSTDPAAESPPGQFKVVSVIMLVLGVLGMLTIFSLIGSMLIGFVFPPPTANQPGGAFAVEIQKVADRYLVLTYVISICNVVLSIALFAAGLLLLKRKLLGRKIAGPTLITGIVFELVRLAFGIIFSRANQEAISAMPKPTESQEMMVGKFMEVGFFIGIIFSILFATVKIGFYVWALIVSRSSAVRPFLK